MHVNPTEASASELVGLDELERLVMRDRPAVPGGAASRAKQLLPPREVPARELADDEGMAGGHAALFEHRGEPVTPPAQVVDPDGRVDQHH